MCKKKNDYRNIVFLVLKNSTYQFSIDSIDSLYVIQGFSLEESKIYGMMWHKNDVLNYSYTMYDKNLTINKDSTFSSYECALIEQWNIAQLKNDAKKYATFPAENYNHALLITKNGSKCIEYKEFFIPY